MPFSFLCSNNPEVFSGLRAAAAPLLTPSPVPRPLFPEHKRFLCGAGARYLPIVLRAAARTSPSRAWSSCLLSRSTRSQSKRSGTPTLRCGLRGSSPLFEKLWFCFCRTLLVDGGVREEPCHVYVFFCCRLSVGHASFCILAVTVGILVSRTECVCRGCFADWGGGNRCFSSLL